MIRCFSRVALGATVLLMTVAVVACNASSSVPTVSQAVSNGHAALRAHSVGGGEYTAQAPAGHPMSTAVGSFPFVTGVTSVRNSPVVSGCGTNCFEISLNSTSFATPVCGKVQACTGSQSFVFSNDPGSSSEQMWIEDALYEPYTASPKCPAGFSSEAYYCTSFAYYSKSIPNLAMTAANLKSVRLTASVGKSGDRFTLTIGKSQYVVTQKDLTGLAGRWYGVWFAVTGGNGSANFNSGSTITSSIQTDTGLTTPPGCGLFGYLSANNNLTLTLERPAPVKQTFPSVWFTQSNVPPPGGSSCRAVGAASTNATTSEGL